MSPHPLTNFEIQKYYQNEPKFNSAYSRNNLSKVKYGAYVINPNEYKRIGTHWIALYVNNDKGSACYDTTYLDSFGLEHIPKGIEKILRKKNIITNIDRTHAYDSIMCGYFCIGFIDFM